jgi:hypothetical protein
MEIQNFRILESHLIDGVRILFSVNQINHLEVMDWNEWSRFVGKTKQGKIRCAGLEMDESNPVFSDIKEYILRKEQNYRENKQKELKTLW